MKNKFTKFSLLVFEAGILILSDSNGDHFSGWVLVDSSSLGDFGVYEDDYALFESGKLTKCVSKDLFSVYNFKDMKIHGYNGGPGFVSYSIPGEFKDGDFIAPPEENIMSQTFFTEGRKHKLDGPALEYWRKKSEFNETLIEFYIDDKKIEEKDFWKDPRVKKVKLKRKLESI